MRSSSASATEQSPGHGGLAWLQVRWFDGCLVGAVLLFVLERAEVAEPFLDAAGVVEAAGLVVRSSANSCIRWASSAISGQAAVRCRRSSASLSRRLSGRGTKTPSNVPLASQGADAGKTIVGGKRGILTDTIGLTFAICGIGEQGASVMTREQAVSP